MKNKNNLLLAATAFLLAFFSLQAFSQVAEEFVDALVPAVKCKKVNDSEVYCKSGNTFTFKCATATSDNCN